MAGAVACALARQKERVLLAVELDAVENDGLQRAWQVTPREFRAAVRRLMPLTGPRADGVASAAMLDMLAALHREHSRGRHMGVVAFNSARDEAQRARFAHLPGQGTHEAAQAENIRAAAQHGRYDRVIVLVGSLHGRKRPVTRQQVTFEPMAMRLAPADQVTSLLMVNGAGTSWSCQLKDGIRPQPGQAITSDMIGCGPRPMRGNDALSGPPRVGAGLPAGADQDYQSGYDGWFWTGPVTASPPGFQEAP